uniref:Transposase, Ptta/En/Spm n=1 Tax=Tanacetum cinerariifolium TaxID=118510 RepID=A0A6L2K774_TANCI|nr:transposase, Ptta/En/Spm [Tanacetum cinerariifolium]
MFEEQAKQELFDTVKAFHACKQGEGQSDYDQFIQNYNMHNMGKSIVELHAMLKLHEKCIPKKAENLVVLVIQEGYPKETMGNYFYYPLENKIFVARNAEFFENNLLVQEASKSHAPLESSGSDEGLKLIQKEDTKSSKNTSEEHNEFAPIVVEPQNVEVPIRRYARISQAQDIYGFYVDVEEYELGDLIEPPNYKAVFSDPECDKWLEAIMARSTFERGGTSESVFGPEDESNAESSHARRCSNFINQDPRDPSKRPLITLDSGGFADTKVSHTITTIFKNMFNGSWTTLKEVNKIFFVGKCDYIMVREVWEDAMKNCYPNIMLKARNVTDVMVHEICKSSDDSSSHSKGLARGPLRYAWSYKGYFVNGFKFNTEKYIEGQVRHNNGVCVKGACYNETKCDFYGLLEEVIEVAYRGVGVVL